ncbi:hypothetical protein ANCCAN_10228 [Ancylostoma caninum]|uniref:Uncharacterized protein n=1 Tax=Ancylostoma caninum TaxID=29170 RepID=A0A368GHA1_ANCCA|nr:hypothetical protein ANCCAN_10228 [Ancylostoma caninum]
MIKMPTAMYEENESSLEEGEEATSLEDRFDGGEVVTCTTSEVNSQSSSYLNARNVFRELNHLLQGLLDSILRQRSGDRD